MLVDTVDFIRGTPTIEVTQDQKSARTKPAIALSFAMGRKDPAPGSSSRAVRDSVYHKSTYRMTPAEAINLGNMLLNAAAAHQAATGA